jgi:hypothetical protein
MRKHLVGQRGIGQLEEQSEQQNFVLFLVEHTRHCFNSAIMSGKCLSQSLAAIGASLALDFLFRELKADIISSAMAIV